MNLGLSLFIVYLLGKVATVAIHQLHFGSAAAFVLLWQDALIAIAVALISRLSKPLAWTLYSIASIHFAISMPLMRLMATPLTAPLLRAGSGTLADSMTHCLDALNLSLLGGTLLLAGILPFLLGRFPLHFKPRLVFTIAIGILAGFCLTSSSDLQGLHRNSLFALVRSFNTQSVISVSAKHNSTPSPLHGQLAGANVLLIALESTGAKHLSTYGAATDPMPFLSQLAREGVVFENAYAAYPESIKGLFTILFSRQPQFGFNPENLAKKSMPSLASRLAESGYETALFHSGRFMYLGMDNVIAAARFSQASDAGEIGGNHNSSFGVDDFSSVDYLLHWLDHRNRSQPFFIHYLPIAGHHPYEVPIDGPFSGSDDVSRYLNARHYSDLALKRLVHGLEERDLLRNTLVIVYGDHGEAFDEHPGNYGHTLYLYEENLRVPLIFWSASGLKPHRVARVTSLVDLAPTICDVLGLDIAPTFEGASAFSPGDQPAIFLTEYSMHLRGIRAGRWKFIFEQDTGYARLYDLNIDPSERTNLARAHPEIVRDLRRRFFDWSDPARPPTIIANPKTVAQR
jgi:arylsulfatase A-like enzyme